MRALRGYDAPLDGAQLRRILSGDSPPPAKDAGVDADLESVLRSVAELAPDVAAPIPASTDAVLAPVLHTALRSAPRRLLLDMRFWHWMTCEQFPDYVLRRWASDVDVDVDVSLTAGQQERFLGNASLVGISRNALARLYWCADTLYSETDGYELVGRMLSNQDLFTGVFERQFGLVKPVARACARGLLDRREDERRAALRRLNLEASTVCLEALTEADVMELLGG